MAKLITVCGATGGVGGSVARRMLKEGWSVRAITRNTESAAAKALAEQGAQLASANYDDVASLEQAFKVQYSEIYISITSLTVHTGQQCNLRYHQHLRVPAREEPRGRCCARKTTARQHCHCGQQDPFSGTLDPPHPAGWQEAF